jgi:hypothetical protein
MEARVVEFGGLHGNGFSVGYVGEFAGWLSRQLRLKAAGSRTYGPFSRLAVFSHCWSSLNRFERVAPRSIAPRARGPWEDNRKFMQFMRKWMRPKYLAGTARSPVALSALFDSDVADPHEGRDAASRRIKGRKTFGRRETRLPVVLDCDVCTYVWP